MAPVPFIIKRHDLLPNMEVNFFEADGVTPLDLSQALSINIVSRIKGNPALEFKKPLTAFNAVQGQYYYDWETGDTDAAGTKEAEFEILWPGQAPQTVPVDSYIEYTVVADIG